MAWTYDATNIGTDTAVKRRNAVRFLIGDTDTNDQQLADEEIDFLLAEENDEVYMAAALSARAIASKYARLVDTGAEGVDASYSQRQVHYEGVSRRLAAQARDRSKIGPPSAGGISQSDMDSVEDDSDRVKPAFRHDDFRNPPADHEQ